MDEYVVWMEVKYIHPLKRLTSYNTLEDAMRFVREYPVGLCSLSIVHYRNGEMCETIHDFQIFNP